MRSLHAFWMVTALLACGEDVEFNASGAGASPNGTPSATTGTGAMTGSGGSSSVGGSGPGCKWSADANSCNDGFYCNAPDCMNGTCEPISVEADGVQAVVCGCDQVNYWNPTTAANYGMAVASMGECAQPTTCTTDKKCPKERHFCAQIVHDANGCNSMVVSGVCWGMPKDCPPVTISGTFRPCSNGALEPCVDECTAIKAQRKHYEDATCPQ